MRADSLLARLRRTAPLATLAFAFALTISGLPGCGSPPEPASGSALFPLAKGHVWTYRVTTELESDAPSSRELTLRTLGPEAMPLLDGQDAWRRRSDDGVDYWLRSDASGIYRVAARAT